MGDCAGLDPSLNALSNGSLRTRTCTRSAHHAEVMGPAIARVHTLALREACRLSRARRDFDLSGVAAVEAMTKSTRSGPYSMRSVGVTQVPMVAHAIHKPPKSSKAIPLLEALPHEEACFYSLEHNVLDLNGKNQFSFRTIEQHYGFVGGSEQQYVQYFHRDDLPEDSWSWHLK